LNWRYQLALLKFENSEYEDAINTLLDMIMIDRNWNNKAAHNLLIYIFNYLGSEDKITIEGRKKLFKILY
jgi:thioredoxin-like negative regulator of GroEL